MSSLKEADIVRAILRYLKTVPNCFCWKEHGGMYGTAGIPDVIACIGGRFFAFEVKTEKGKATALQESALRNAGGDHGMTAKEYMKQAQRLLRRIDRKQKEADALRQKLSFPKSPAYSDLPKPVSPESHTVESGVSQILSLEEEVKTAKKELEALKAVFDTAIKAVTDTEHHDILAKRYLEFKDWNQIAEEMGYSKPSCYRLHRKALAGMKS